MASSKAAASEETRRTLRYVEPLSDARTPLADFFSILLDLQLGDGGNEQIEKMPISRRTLLAFRDKLDRNFE